MCDSSMGGNIILIKEGGKLQTGLNCQELSVHVL